MLARFGCPCAATTRTDLTSSPNHHMLLCPNKKGVWCTRIYFLPLFSFISFVRSFIRSFLICFILFISVLQRQNTEKKNMSILFGCMCVCLIHRSMFTSTLPSVLFVFVIRMSFTLAIKWWWRRLLTWQYSMYCMIKMMMMVVVVAVVVMMIVTLVFIFIIINVLNAIHVYK